MNQVGYIKTIRPEYVHFFLQDQQNIEDKYESSFEKNLNQYIKASDSKSRIKTILTNIFLFNQNHEKFKEEYSALSIENQACRFYCLSCLAYPFFRNTVEYIGRQFRLHEEVSTSQIEQYMKKLYGDRRRVEIAVSSVLSSLYYWGLINRTRVGIYTQSIQSVDFPTHRDFLLDVLMTSADYSSVTNDALENSPIFFPFDYHVSLSILKQGPYRIIHSMSDIMIERNP